MITLKSMDKRAELIRIAPIEDPPGGGKEFRLDDPRVTKVICDGNATHRSNTVELFLDKDEALDLIAELLRVGQGRTIDPIVIRTDVSVRFD